MDAGHPAEQHRRYEEMAVAHVLGGLDEVEGRDFRSHLLDCTHCRARVGELRALAHDLADVERDERRVRATRSVETKRRDIHEDAESDQEPGRMFRPRIMTVLGVAAILALSAWNFTLRETVDRIDQDMRRSAEAAAVLEFGTSGDVIRRGQGVRGEAKTDRGSLVVLVDGLEDGRVHMLYLVDGEGRPVFQAPVQPTEGRLFSLLEYHEGAERVLITLPEEGPTADVSGETVFEATIVPPAAS